MIFDVQLHSTDLAEFTCALEDYDEDYIYEKYFTLLEDNSVYGGGWTCRGVVVDDETIPPWALRLAKVLEPRIQAMLLTGQPRDLRRWIDDEELDAIETELANRNDRLPANV